MFVSKLNNDPVSINYGTTLPATSICKVYLYNNYIVLLVFFMKPVSGMQHVSPDDDDEYSVLKQLKADSL